MNRKLSSLMVAGIAFALAACDAMPAPVCTESNGGIAATITVAKTVLPASGDVVVRGTITAASDITLYKVLVAGIAANNDGFDFDSFDATIPYATLQSLASGSSGKAHLKVTAVTNCSAPGGFLEIGSVDVPVIGKAVTSLSLTPVTPGTAALTTSPAGSMTFELLANPEATGATVVVSTSLGTVNGQQSTTVTLSGDGTAQARAMFVLVADATKEGTAKVIATAPNTEPKTYAVKTVAPPRFVQGAVALVPGTIRISISSSDNIASCTATAAPHVSVMSGPNDLTATNVVTDLNNDGRPDIDITTDSSATAPTATTTITCFDTLGQFVSGTFALPKS